MNVNFIFVVQLFASAVANVTPISSANGLTTSAPTTDASDNSAVMARTEQIAELRNSTSTGSTESLPSHELLSTTELYADGVYRETNITDATTVISQDATLSATTETNVLPLDTRSNRLESVFNTSVHLIPALSTDSYMSTEQTDVKITTVEDLPRSTSMTITISPWTTPAPDELTITSDDPHQLPITPNQIAQSTRLTSAHAPTLPHVSEDGAIVDSLEIDLSLGSYSDANNSVGDTQQGGPGERDGLPTTWHNDTNTSDVASDWRDHGVTETLVERRSSCYRRPNVLACNVVRETLNSSDKDSIYDHVALKWYYDPVEMSCFFTSDCLLRDEAFNTQDDCEKACLPPQGLSRCLAPPKAGFFQCNSREQPSTTPILAVFFDKTTGKCRWFTYYGCGGTGNRFWSIKECETVCGDKAAAEILSVATVLCQAAPTDLPVDRDLMSSFLSKESEQLVRNISYSRALQVEPGCANYGQLESRWYMKKSTKTCEEFSYSHCGGSANNFLTRTDCEWFCSASQPTSEDICHLPVVTGGCADFRQVWYFDQTVMQPSADRNSFQSGACRTFNYSGCGGNSNRFQTEKECTRVCASFSKSIITVPPNDKLGSVMGKDVSSAPNTTNSGSATQSSAVLNITKFIQSTAPTIRQKPTLQNIDLEPCRKPPITGSCRPLNCTQDDCQPLRLLRWFFDAHTSHCEPFNYSGCGDSVNTFDDAHSCHVACKARIVRPDRDRRCDSLPHHTKCYSLSFSGSSDTASNSHPIAFHFNVESATCKAFHLNTNRTECSRKKYFANGQDCLRECMKSTPMEKHLQNRCFARKTHGISNCTSSKREQISRWSYLAELKQCVRFSQCLSYSINVEQLGNNFASRAECETTCAPKSFEDVCQLPKDAGPCSRTDVRYFYDAKAAQCKVFLYGGCLGNANRFISHQECELACSAFPTRVLESHDKQNGSAVQLNTEPPPITAETFERMQRVTQHHMDHFPWDQCLESHTYGTCPRSVVYGLSSRIFRHTSLTRFFYDRHTGHCQPFTYTGCGSRANHFDTIEYCKQACEDRLKNPKSRRCDTGNVDHHLCAGSGIQAWWFNKSIGDCQSVELCLSAAGHPRDQAWPGPAATFRLRRARQWLGVWQSMKQRYPTGMYASRSACQFHCLPKPVKGTDVQNICHMNPIVTVPYGCNAMVTRWYFEPREGTCNSYVTCPQYGNNFQNEEVCRDVCAPLHPLQICHLPKDHGGCSQFVTRWHYDTDSRSCKSFLYGGCFGNSNKFLTKSECDHFCTMQDICRLPLQKHSTDSSYPKRYHFNQTSRQCEAFQFTGILPHGNNFPSLDACNATCLGGPQIDAIVDVFTAAAAAEEKDSLDWSAHLVDGDTVNRQGGANPWLAINTTSEINMTGLSSSPCFTPYSGYSESTMLEKQSVCDPDDIINELGYRFRVLSSPSNDQTPSDAEGFCELTLVPVCLSEPRQVLRAVFDPSMRSLGRVFQTMAECERTCLQSRRRKRSITGYQTPVVKFGKTPVDKKLMQQFEKLLVDSGFDGDKSVTGDIPNGCRPDQPIGEQIDRFQHTFQVYTRWPCKMDTRAAGDLIPLLETLEGTEEVWLPCWVIAKQRPIIKWTHLKSGRSFMVQSTLIPILQDVWIGHLHLRHLQVFRHNGAWLCEAHQDNERNILSAVIQLHVLVNPFIAQRRQLSSYGAISQHLRIPEGGTLLLLCPTNHTAKKGGYFVDTTVQWQFTRQFAESQHDAQNPMVLTTSIYQPLYIHPVKSALHTGTWYCGTKTHRTSALPGAPKVFQFTVEVNRAPIFVSTGPLVHRHSVSKHQLVQLLTCDALAEPGSPTATLRWTHCPPSQRCWPVRPGSESHTGNTLLVRPVFGDTYVCRYENMWGRVEQLHVFT